MTLYLGVIFLLRPFKNATDAFFSVAGMCPARRPILHISLLIALASFSSAHASRVELWTSVDRSIETSADPSGAGLPTSTSATTTTADASVKSAPPGSVAVEPLKQDAVRRKPAASGLEPAYVAKMWRIRDVGDSETEADEVAWGKTSFKGFSFVLDGKSGILVVHGFGSSTVQRHAAAAKARVRSAARAHANRRARSAHPAVVRVLELELGEQQDYCTAVGEGKPRVDCPEAALVKAVARGQPAASRLSKGAYDARMWEIKKVGQSKPEEVVVPWGETSFQGRSFVLDGKEEILVVHGFGSSSFQKHAAMTKAHAIQSTRTGPLRVGAPRVLELDEKHTICNAVADAAPRVDCT